MKKLALALILCSPMITHAQELTAPIESKAQVCAACHGPKGNSATPIWPNIAGQHPEYLIKQIKEIKEDKTRHAPTMKPMVENLTDQDIDELAAYYAKMPTAEGTTPQKFVKLGEQLYRGGDFSKHIPACIACHGPKGTGNGPAGFPSLSGQHADYTIAQLQGFKDGKRTNDLNHIMRDISSKMSPDEMEAVAHYIEGLY